jgi:hypothetical protein
MIGIEMIGVIQIAFSGLIIINYLQPLLVPLLNLKFMNGTNNILKPIKKSLVYNVVPNRVSSLDY